MKSLIRHPLRLRLASLSLLWLTQLHVTAQTAEDFFHGGAQHYLTNNVPGALQLVTNGLQRFPTDEKLQKLYELLNRQQQQQQNQDQQQDQEQKDDQKQDQQKQDDKKDQQAKNDQQKKDEDQKQQDAGKQDQEKNDQQQANSGDKSKDKPEEKSGETGQMAQQMTPQEAKQLLDAQKDDEQVLIFQPKSDPKKQTKQLKDW